MIQITHRLAQPLPAILLTGLLASLLSFSPGLAKAAGKGIPEKAVARRDTVANSHLHGARVSMTRRIDHRWVAHRWYGRWVFTDWAVLHRGLGNIHGEVHAGNGGRESGVRVALRTSRGRIFHNPAARHVTHTAADGSFVMWHVRIGNYRVHASKGKTSAGMPIYVHGGLGTLVSMKI